MAENGKKYPTWQWLAGLLLMLVLAISAWAWNDTRTCIKDNTAAIQLKVDKEQYYKDITEIKAGLNKIIDIHLGNGKGKKEKP